MTLLEGPPSRADGIGVGPGPADGRFRLAGLIGDHPDGGGPDATGGPIDLVVKDGRIADLAPASGPSDCFIVGMPVFVNAHDHGRGLGNVASGIRDAPLEEWIPLLRGVRSTQEEMVSHGCRAMLASGVGGAVICVNPQGPDVVFEVTAAAQAALAVGIRAAIAYPLADAFGHGPAEGRNATGWPPAVLRRHLEAVEEIATAVDDPRVELQLGPTNPQWVSEASLAAIGESARTTGRRVHMHLLETRVQRHWADLVHPEGIVTFLRECGLVGPHMCFAHGTHLRDEEFADLAESGSIISLNPSSNLRLASGVTPVAAAMDSGVRLGAGLDGLALADDADYWTELRLLRGLEQAQRGASVAAGRWLDSLLDGGRAALGSCAPGALAVGAPADFATVDLSGYEHVAYDHGWALADLALAVGRPERVREVWVAGRRVWSRELGGTP